MLLYLVALLSWLEKYFQAGGHCYTARVSRCEIAPSILTRPTGATHLKSLVVCVYNCDFYGSHH